MNRIDWVIVRRLLGNVGLTLAIVFGIAALFETLNITRLSVLSAADGPGLAALAIVAAAAQWTLEVLPQGLLIGTILGLLNLQTTREMTIIKAAGFSVWRVMAAPLAVVLVLGLAVALLADAAVVQFNRALSPGAQQGATNGSVEPLWIEERAGGVHYILEAGYVGASGDSLGAVTVFMLDAPRVRIEAELAELRGGEWVLPQATLFRSNGAAEALVGYRLATGSSAADMRSRMASVKDMTVYDLASSLSTGLADPAELARTTTRFAKLLALPLTLAGSVLIAFAFTAGYRRTNKYGGAVLYGVVLGFVVYVVTEMAARAGSAGVVQPLIATIGPAIVAIVIGVTVLLNKEDGRT